MWERNRIALFGVRTYSVLRKSLLFTSVDNFNANICNYESNSVIDEHDDDEYYANISDHSNVIRV